MNLRLTDPRPKSIGSPTSAPLRHASRLCHLNAWLPLATGFSLMLAAGFNAQAGDHRWGGTVNSLWSVDANWSSGGAPKVGEANVNLIFPLNGNPSSVQNIVGLEVDTMSIQGSGYNFGAANGARLTLRGGPGALTIGPSHDTLFNSGLAITLANGAVEMNIGTSTDLYIEGQISGRGGLVKTGPGAIEFAGTQSNNYSGLTDVQVGTLRLNKTSATAIPAALRIGLAAGTPDSTVVRLLKSSQISDTSVISFLRTGLLDLIDLNDGAAGLNFDGGHLTTGNGIFSLGGGVNVAASSSTATIDGRLSLGNAVRTFNVDQGSASPELAVNAILSSTSLQSAGIFKSGGGELRLLGNNTYAGPTTVSAGMLGVYNGHALGLGDSGNLLLNQTTVLNGGVLFLSGVTIADEALILNGSGTNGFPSLTGGSGNALWNSPIRLASDSSIGVSVLGNLYINGAISGPGGITTSGSGLLQLSGDAPNTYAGTTRVLSGTLELNKLDGITAISGPLVIGDGLGILTDQVVLKGHNQIADSAHVTLLPTGQLNLGNYSESIDSLEMTGGSISSALGTLTLLGDVTVHTADVVAEISGKLSLGGATRTIETIGHNTSPDLRINAQIVGGGGFFPGITKTGSGELLLAGVNSYNGLTIAEAGSLEISNGGALGSSLLGTIIHPGAALVIFGNISVQNESLTLDHSTILSRFGTSIWGGPLTMTGACSIEVLQAADKLTLNGSIGGNGGFAKLGLGTLELLGPDANTYTQPTLVNGGTLRLGKGTGLQPAIAIPGDLIVGDNSGGADADKVVWAVGHQIADSSQITLNGSGELLMDSVTDTVGSLEGSGHVQMLFSSLNTGGKNLTTTFSGPITGAESTLRKQGSGTMTLTADHNFAGEFAIDGGTLLANGDQHFTIITINPGGTFGGTGLSKSITSTGGTLSPGSGPGILRAGKVTLDAGSTLRMELNGAAPGSGYDQVISSGLVTLGGAKLEVTSSFNSAVGTQFMLMKLDGVGSPSGTFANLVNGSVITVNKVKYTLNYTGGDGNDVVLTRLNTPASLQSIAITTPVQEGKTATVNGVISDPDPLDTFKFTVTWGDGSPVQNVLLPAGTVSFSVSHTYLDDQPTGTPSDFTLVNYSLTDLSGTGAFGNLSLILLNTSPIVSLTGGSSVQAGSLYLASGSFKDPGADVWSATVDYGDGTGAHALALNADKTFSLGHTYASEGKYLITVLVLDDDTGIGSATLSIVIDAADPAPTLSIAQGQNQRVIISWPAPSTGWSLFSSADLLQPVWTAVQNAPVANGNRLEVTLDGSDGVQFFRLMK